MSGGWSRANAQGALAALQQDNRRLTEAVSRMQDLGEAEPRGVAGAKLMVLVGQPEPDDGDGLLSGNAGRQLDAIIRAMGFEGHEVYLASALPAPAAMPDWFELARAGLGEIVRTYTTVSRQGGQLKLVNLTKRITDLLMITKLLTVFGDINRRDINPNNFDSFFLPIVFVKEISGEI